MLSEPATALRSEAIPKIVRLASNSGRRPNRSPIGPAQSAPTIMPILNHKNAIVNVDGGRCQSRINDGAAQATELTSAVADLHERTQSSDTKLPTAQALILERSFGRRQCRCRHPVLSSACRVFWITPYDGRSGVSVLIVIDRSSKRTDRSLAFRRLSSNRQARASWQRKASVSV